MQFRNSPHSTMKPVKTLIYGMQSSGASLFTCFMGQREDSIAIIDLYIQWPAPRAENARGEHLFLKATLSTALELNDHLRDFQPDKSILFLRNPYLNYHSLQSKPYATDWGSVDSKFEALEQCFSERTDHFDTVIHYEDFLFQPHKVIEQLNDLDLGFNGNHLRMPRSLGQIYLHNLTHWPWSFRNYWSFGNIHVKSRREPPSVEKFTDLSRVPDEMIAKVDSLCPTLCRHYRETVTPELEAAELPVGEDGFRHLSPRKGAFLFSVLNGSADLIRGTKKCLGGSRKLGTTPTAG